MIKRTIVIWQEDFTDISFFVLEGDYTKFEDLFIGTCEGNEALVEELSKLIWNDDYTEYRVKMLDRFPHHLYVSGATAIIIAGVIP